MSKPRHAQAERPNGTDICRVVPTERSGGRASAVSNTYWSSDQPSERSRPEQRGLDFDGNVLEIRSSRRTTAYGGRGTQLPYAVLLCVLRPCSSSSSRALRAQTRPAIEFVSGKEGLRPTSSSISVLSLSDWT